MSYDTADPFAIEVPADARPTPAKVVLAPEAPTAPPEPVVVPDDVTAPRPGQRSDEPALTEAQRHTFDELLAIGAERPVASAELVTELHRNIADGTAEALESWPQGSLWLGKSLLASVLRCEGLTVAERSQTGPRKMHPATATGIVSHAAIQIFHTHPGMSIAACVRHAIEGSRRTDAAFSDYWADADVAGQSNLIAMAETRVSGFLDSWPPLREAWNPRFEVPVQARLGRLILAARPDITLGRPRPNHVQSMMLVDFKTGALGEHHELEADFYALVAALRYRVPPFRSTVYSLASGEWTDPDVTAERLERCAARVVDAVGRLCDVLTDTRPPVLTPGDACRFCPVRATCPSGPVLAPIDDNQGALS